MVLELAGAALAACRRSGTSLGGEFTSVRPSPGRAEEPDPRLPNWFTGDPSPDWSEGPHLGAKTVSRWRADFLSDFASRLDRCRAPQSAR